MLLSILVPGVVMSGILSQPHTTTLSNTSSVPNSNIPTVSLSTRSLSIMPTHMTKWDCVRVLLLSLTY